MLHLLFAAFLAVSDLGRFVNFAVRAFAPACQDRVRPDFSLRGSYISHVAIHAGIIAHPIKSAGLFSPFGPTGINYCSLRFLLRKDNKRITFKKDFLRY